MKMITALRAHHPGASRCIAVLFLLAMVTNAGAAVPDVPLGVAPGSVYHWAFVTQGTRDATSTAIADYNAFVSAEANAAGSLTASAGIANWYAIASTDAVDARDNAVVSGPVFLVHGGRLADSAADFWDGSIKAVFSRDQFNNLISVGNVWTGSTASGEAVRVPPGGYGFNGYLGTTASPRAGVGYTYSIGSSWALGTYKEPTESLHLYALSPALTAVPLPPAVLLLGAGVGALLARRPRT